MSLEARDGAAAVAAAAAAAASRLLPVLVVLVPGCTPIPSLGTGLFPLLTELERVPAPASVVSVVVALLLLRALLVSARSCSMRTCCSLSEKCSASTATCATSLYPQRQENVDCKSVLMQARHQYI